MKLGINQEDANTHCTNMLEHQQEDSSGEPKCEICRQLIDDLYYLTIGSSMCVHERCLKCATCESALNEYKQTCFYRNGRFFCSSEHAAEAVKKEEKDVLCSSSSSRSCCHMCQRPIHSNEYFIRLDMARAPLLFHLECFRCAQCLCRLEPGSLYGILAASGCNEILCSYHYRLAYGKLFLRFLFLIFFVLFLIVILK